MSPRVRFGCLACLLVVTSTTPSQGQGVAWETVKLDYETIAGNDLNLMRKLYSGDVTVRGANEKANKEYLRKFAKTLIYPATQKQYYISSSEDFRVRPRDENFQIVINELNSVLIVPTPGNRIDQMRIVQAAYVTEFGLALDEAIGTALRKPDMPPVVKTNLARLLAESAKSGAPALAQTIQKMLDHTYFVANGKPQDTPPEVLLYALQAAGNILAAYDIAVQNSPAAARHSIPEDDLIKFLTTLQKYAISGPTKPLQVYVPSPDGSGRSIDLNEKVAPQKAVEKAPKAPATGLLPEQVAVTVYFRRAAIKALANARFAVIGGSGGSADVRPALTLARVAVDDRTIPLPVTPAEALEATIGLANLEPSTTMDIPSYVAALALGVRQAAGPKAATPSDMTLPAKITGMRLTRAFESLAKRAGTNPRLVGSQKLLTDLAEIVVADVSNRLAGEANAAAAPDFGRLDTYLNNLPPAPTGRKLFADKPDSLLVPRGAR